jgi:type IV secretory pathway VirB2 component (pilin)
MSLNIAALVAVAVVVVIGAAKQFGIIDADFASTALTTLLAGGGGFALGKGASTPKDGGA